MERIRVRLGDLARRRKVDAAARHDPRGPGRLSRRDRAPRPHPPPATGFPVRPARRPAKRHRMVGLLIRTKVRHSARLTPRQQTTPLLAPATARGALARSGCGRLRVRPVSRTQRGPCGALQDRHDSRSGSRADGPRDVPARILSEHRPYAAFLPRGSSPAGLHSTGLSNAREEAEGMTDGAARAQASATCAAEPARILTRKLLHRVVLLIAENVAPATPA